MSELTLESLAKRIDVLEQKLKQQSSPVKDWRSVVGMFDQSEIMPSIIAEGKAIRDAERERARQGSES